MSAVSGERELPVDVAGLVFDNRVCVCGGRGSSTSGVPVGRCCSFELSPPHLLHRRSPVVSSRVSGLWPALVSHSPATRAERSKRRRS